MIKKVCSTTTTPLHHSSAHTASATKNTPTIGVLKPNIKLGTQSEL